MSPQILKPNIYTTEHIISVRDARNKAEIANETISEKKAELFALAMSTPKDIILDDEEEPFYYIKEKFNEIFEELTTGIIDNYIYTMCADDAEYNEGSLVKEAFDEIKRDNEKGLEEEQNRKRFFRENTALNSYNFDDNKIYEYYRDDICVGIELPITTEDGRNAALTKIKEHENNLLQSLLNKKE